MGFLSFGSKKDKIKKLIEEERFNDILTMVLKDKKALDGLIELLDDSVPGIRGDALLILGTIAEQRSDVLEPYLEKVFPKAIELTKNRNPYVKENAMVLSYELVRRFRTRILGLKGTIVSDLIEELKEGDKNIRGFALMLLGELDAKETREYVEEFVNVEDKVILPFEGKKWVTLGQIARETLEKLS
ncbi:HEAT repeat domain-containing protein [Thermococcus sp. CX2]|uniref:HEAT repeat domain-containing protein n=1 Tax=Thermococcus sp. CX2 TaxID=163006 RepID=UPI00143C1795|nr:HEAT repeat domain-containing protein [Thermococcus sp. CX2]